MSAAIAIELRRLSCPTQLTHPSVPPKVAGSFEVEVKALSALLGRAAWRVWECLTHRRDIEGVTHATRLGIAGAFGFEKTSEREVKRGLKRLRQAGLIADLGWASRLVPSREAGHTIYEKVYERIVLGARVASSTKIKMMVIPKQTQIWMRTAHTWGGARVGSGRKKTRQIERPQFELLQGGRLGDLTLDSKQQAPKLTVMASKRPSSKVKPPKPNGFQGGPPISVKRRTPGRGSEPFVPLRGTQGPAAFGDEPPDSNLARNRPRSAKPKPRTVRGSAPKAPASPPLTRTMRGRGENAELVLTPGAHRSSAPLQIRAELLPPPPWDLDIPMIKIPSPPLLESSLGVLRRRSFIARFWRSAYVSRFGEKDTKASRACFARGPKITHVIDEACETFIELGLVPGSWMAWCFDQATNFDWGPANPWWVLRPAFMIKCFDWYRETASIEGSKVIMTDAHRELWTRWHAMNKAARFASTVSDVRSIVDEHLSFSECARLVELAGRQAADKQRSYTRLARSGDLWIW